MSQTTALKSFDWSLIQTFIAAFDTGSMLGAARRLGVQQPTVSRQIAELESQLGAALFERTGRGVSPTATAHSLIDAARDMAGTADSLLRTLSSASAKTTGVVRLTASEAVASYWLPPILARFAAQHAGIAIEIEASNQVSNLLRRDADIALRMVRPEQGSLIAKKLGEVRMQACAHADYLAQRGTPASPQDLLAHTLIGYDQDTHILRGFAETGVPVTRDQFALRTDNLAVYASLIASGAGVGFMDSVTIRGLPGVVPVLQALAIPPLPCWLAVHREIHASRVVRLVYDFLAVEVAAQLAKP